MTRWVCELLGQVRRRGDGGEMVAVGEASPEELELDDPSQLRLTARDGPSSS